MSRNLSVLIVLSIILSSPTVLGANSVDYSEKEMTIFTTSDLIGLTNPTAPTSIPNEVGMTVTKSICGYSLNRTIRGDCSELPVDRAPGERWFMYDVPANSMGNHIEVKIENLADPHLVDLSISACVTNKFNQNEIQCNNYTHESYGDSEVVLLLSPVVTERYWIRVVAWDEEKENRNPGGDLTEIRVGIYRNISSNLDRSEPEIISVGDKLERKVCAAGCTSGDPDPMDIFLIQGFQGDVVEIHFGSREDDFFSNKWLLVRVWFEHDYFDLSKPKISYTIDDQYHYDSNRGSEDAGVSKLVFEFEQSGNLYISFWDMMGNSESESYTIEVMGYDSDNRDWNADFDQDGVPDFDEHICGTNLFDSSDFALDSDQDGACDIIDPDDDGDGVLDAIDEFPLDPAEWIDSDGDNIGDNADSDDDNDGWDDYVEVMCATSYLSANSVPSDTDNDGSCNYLDSDDDNDGHLDSVDVFPLDFAEWADLDGDGVGDNYDLDIDGDGVHNGNDRFPLDSSEWSDTDNDEIGDNSDTDDDDDGWEDNVEILCSTSPYSAISIPRDTDSDTICDILDADDDDDGVNDDSDLWPKDSTRSTDRDGDGISEQEEGAFLDFIHKRYIIPSISILTIIMLSLMSWLFVLQAKRR